MLEFSTIPSLENGRLSKGQNFVPWIVSFLTPSNISEKRDFDKFELVNIPKSKPKIPTNGERTI